MLNKNRFSVQRLLLARHSPSIYLHVSENLKVCLYVCTSARPAKAIKILQLNLRFMLDLNSQILQP